MSMTLDQLIEEAHRLPPGQISELIDRLTLDLLQKLDPSVEEAWNQEAQRRLNEMESGAVKGVPGDEVSARIRKIVGR